MWIERLTGSLRRRGFLGTARLLPRVTRAGIAQAIDPLFDLRHRTRTGGVIELAGLECVGPNKHRGVRYEPTWARPLSALFERLALPPEGRFVDLGCGKGRVLMVAAAHGFHRLVGVEFSAALAVAARQNLRRYLEQRRIDAEVDIQHLDAADYTVHPDDRVFFLFNPFDGVVLTRVLARIERSLATHPRPVWIVYHKAVWRRVLDHATPFTLVGEYALARGFAVYKSVTHASMEPVVSDPGGVTGR